MTQIPATHPFVKPLAAIRDLSAGKARSKHHSNAGPQAGTTTIASRANLALKAFNTWAYKREQPSCADSLRDVVVRAMTEDAPIPFVLYWGKGPRSEVAAPDLVCLDYLAGMAARIRAAYQNGASIRLILTDTHAQLNGHAATAVDAYFRAVARAAAARGFEAVRLSTIVAGAVGRTEPEADMAPCGVVLDNLIACAAKWYRGEGSIEVGAIEYYRMNMVEKRAVEFAYPHAVFATFNGAEFRELFPAAMPVFYMYSLKRGVGVKPWFMPADDAVITSTLGSVSRAVAVESH